MRRVHRSRSAPRSPGGVRPPRRSRGRRPGSTRSRRGAGTARPRRPRRKRRCRARRAAHSTAPFASKKSGGAAGGHQSPPSPRVTTPADVDRLQRQRVAAARREDAPDLERAHALDLPAAVSAGDGEQRRNQRRAQLRLLLGERIHQSHGAPARVVAREADAVEVGRARERQRHALEEARRAQRVARACRRRCGCARRPPGAAARPASWWEAGRSRGCARPLRSGRRRGAGRCGATARDSAARRRRHLDRRRRRAPAARRSSRDRRRCRAVDSRARRPARSRPAASGSRPTASTTPGATVPPASSASSRAARSIARADAGRIDFALEAVRRFAVQSETARGAAHADARRSGRSRAARRWCASETSVSAPPITPAIAMARFGVGDDQVVARRARASAVERRDASRPGCARRTWIAPPRSVAASKRVERLAELEHHQVRDVDDDVDRAHAGRFEFGGEPRGTRAHRACRARRARSSAGSPSRPRSRRAPPSAVGSPASSTSARGGSRSSPPKCARTSRAMPEHRRAVAAVRRQRDLEHDVAGGEHGVERRARPVRSRRAPGCRRSSSRDAEFLRRADHAVRDHAADLRLPELLAVGQRRARARSPRPSGPPRRSGRRTRSRPVRRRRDPRLQSDSRSAFGCCARSTHVAHAHARTDRARCARCSRPRDRPG